MRGVMGSLLVLAFLVCGLASLAVSWAARDTAVLLAEQHVNHVPSPSEQILLARQAEEGQSGNGGWWAFGALLCGGMGLVGLVVAPKFLKEGRLAYKAVKGKRGRQRPYPPTSPRVPHVPMLEDGQWTNDQSQF